jgi:hypothetical protein
VAAESRLHFLSRRGVPGLARNRKCKSHATRNLRRIRGNFDATPLKISATRSEFQQLRTSENEPTNYVIAP